MKEKVFTTLMMVFILSIYLLVHSTSARLEPRQGAKVLVKDNGVASSFTELMGSEECIDEDEESLKRRVIAEAHLDYIYTQHHKP